jgi:hypothetical protein
MADFMEITATHTTPVDATGTKRVMRDFQHLVAKVQQVRFDDGWLESNEKIVAESADFAPSTADAPYTYLSPRRLTRHVMLVPCFIGKGTEKNSKVIVVLGRN